MTKKIFLLFIIVFIMIYLVVSFSLLNNEPVTLCKKIELNIKDSVNSHFISKKEIINILNKKGLSPINKKVSSINTNKIEKEVKNHPLIEKIECYKTPLGNIHFNIYQRIPILRVLYGKNNFYVDNKGNLLYNTEKCVAHVPIVTGFIKKEFIQKELYQFGSYINKNPFWNAQIEQIIIDKKKNIKIIPRVGNHVIYFGEVNNYEKKLKRLRLFYSKVLNKVGWNKYSIINIELNNQIICTKH